MYFWHAACCFLFSAAAICAPISSRAAFWDADDLLPADSQSEIEQQPDGEPEPADGALQDDPDDGAQPADDLDVDGEPESADGAPQDDPGDGAQPADDLDADGEPEPESVPTAEPEPPFFEKPFAEYNTTEGLLFFILIVLMVGMVFKLIGGILYG